MKRFSERSCSHFLPGFDSRMLDLMTLHTLTHRETLFFFFFFFKFLFFFSFLREAAALVYQCVDFQSDYWLAAFELAFSALYGCPDVSTLSTSHHLAGHYVNMQGGGTVISSEWWLKGSDADFYFIPAAPFFKSAVPHSVLNKYGVIALSNQYMITYRATPATTCWRL